ncbi:MAG: sodium-dependent transporter [Oscillospiraceae bacterium]
MEKEVTLEKRDGFNSKWGFILACIGSAVGMGNIWRFPVMVSTYGGLTFLIPYFIFVLLIGASGVIEEMALGRAAGAGPIGAFGMCTEKRMGNKKLGEAIGIIPVLGSLALGIGYAVIMGWIFKYTFMAFTGKLAGMGQDMAQIGGMFDSTASAFGNNLWLVIGLVAAVAIIGLVVAVVIMALGVSNGIEKANKIMMPALFIMFVALGIYIFTLPGASDGYKYIFTLNPAGLLNPKVWIFAFGQAFFSLSIAGNGTVIYGSYLSKKENVPVSARNVAIFDTLAALLAAFVIIPAMAAGGAELSSGGPGLMFIYLVNVFNAMPGGRIVGIVFYICVLFAGITSIINLFEAPVATLQERFHLKRLPSVLIIGGIGCAVAICIQGIVSGWMDAVSIYICPLGAMLAGIMFFWVLKKDHALEAVNMGREKPIGKWFIPLGKFGLVPLALIALIAGAILGGIG